jgi:hypothetical protein
VSGKRGRTRPSLTPAHRLRFLFPAYGFLRPSRIIPRLDLLHHPVERQLKVDPLTVGHADQHEKNVGHFHPQITLGLLRLLGLLPKSVIDLAGELTNLLGQPSQVGQRMEIPLLELAYPDGNSMLELSESLGSGVRSQELLRWGTLSFETRLFSDPCVRLTPDS